MKILTAAITKDLAPNGALRASINLGNPVLAQGTPTAPSGVTVDIARRRAMSTVTPLGAVGVPWANTGLPRLIEARSAPFGARSLVMAAVRIFMERSVGHLCD